MRQSRGLRVPNKLHKHLLSMSDYNVAGSTLSVISNHSSQNNSPSLNNISIVCSQLTWMHRQRNSKPRGPQAVSRHFSCLFPPHTLAAFSVSLCSSIAGLRHVATRKVQDAIQPLPTGTHTGYCTSERAIHTYHMVVYIIQGCATERESMGYPSGHS